MKRAVVIQGGGSFGAFTAGRICQAGGHYDLAVGSSTGALIAPFAVLGGVELLKLEKAYTTTSNKDIYTKYPFWAEGIPNIFMAVTAWLKQKKGLTDSKPLRKMIRKYFTEPMYDSLLESNKDVIVTVCALNFASDASIYVSAKDQEDYEEFCDAIWASTLIPGVFEPFNYNDEIDYVDGGTTENLGLKKAVELGFKDIDVFLHTLANTAKIKEQGKNWVHNLIRAVEIQRQEVIEDDLKLFKLNSYDLNLKVNYLPFELTGAKRMEFIPEVMTKWFNEGRKYESKK